MSKKAQRISFVMMIVFFLTGIAMTIVTAVTIGTGFGTRPSYYDEPNPFAQFVFPIVWGGLVTTCSVTAVWWAVLEHFKNVEKSLDQLYRAKTGKEELSDNEYSYIPSFSAQPPYQPYPPYPPQYGQPVPTYQQMPPAQPPMPPVQQAQPQPMQHQEPPVLPEQPVNKEWFCSHCGAPNQFDSNFCSSCGNKKV